MITFWKYLAEVNKADLAKIGKRINSFAREETETFHDLFGGKLRLVIPMLDDMQKDFMKFLSEQGLFSIDIKKGTALIKVETQQGERNREVRINKFIQDSMKRNKIGPEGQQWIAWYEKTKDKFSNSQSGVSIVISRHPIDILRMSDHGEWSSCHSPDGSYYKCAVQEARTGGAVAYVVRNSELQKIKDINAKEIFKDPDRGVEGASPLERVRLRRFTDGDNDLLVPEIRTYGIKHVGFYDSIKSWASENQKATLSQANFKDLKLKGGSYQDNNAGEIWSSFVDKNTTGSKKSIDQEDEASKEEDLAERIEALINGHNYKHFSVHGGDGEENYVRCDGSTSFVFPASKLIREFPGWQDKGYRLLTKEITDALGEADLYGVQEVNFEKHQESFYINVNFTDEDGEGNIDSLEHFLDSIDDLDKDHFKLFRAVEHVLMEMKYIKNDFTDLASVNFKYQKDSDRDGVTHAFVAKKPIEVGSLDGLHAIGMRYFKNDNFGWCIAESRTGVEAASTEFTKVLRQILLKNVGQELMEKIEAHCTVEINKPLPLESQGDASESDYADAVISDTPVFITVELYHDPDKKSDSTDFSRMTEVVMAVDKIYARVIQDVREWWSGVKSELVELQSDLVNSPGFKMLSSNARHQLDRRLATETGGVTLKKDQRGLRFWYEDAVAGVSMPYVKFRKLVISLLKAAEERYKKKMGEQMPGSLVLRFAKGKPHIFYKGGRYGQEVEEKLNDYIGHKNGMSPEQAQEMGEEYIGKFVKYNNQDIYGIVYNVENAEEGSMPKINVYTFNTKSYSLERSRTNPWSVELPKVIPQVIKNTLKAIVSRHSEFFNQYPEVLKIAAQGV